MDSKKQQMNFMHQMCQKQLIEMQIRIERYLQDSERVQQILHERSVAVADVISPAGRRGFHMDGELIFDRYMAQMSSIVNMARKFSIHLQLNELSNIVLRPTETNSMANMEIFGSQTSLLEDFLQQSTSCVDLSSKNDSVFESRELKGADGLSPMPKDLQQIVNANKTNETPTKMNVNAKQSDKFKFPYVDTFLSSILPQKDLSHFTEGHTFSAFITFVEDFIDLEFFICEVKDSHKLFEISSSLDIKPIDKSSLSNVVFGVSQDKESAVHGNNLIWRAAKIPEDVDDSRDSILLIDFGEIIQITESCQTYSISAAYREHPPLAIRCVLKGVCGLDDVVTTDRNKCKKLLSCNVFEMAKFRVLYQESRILHLAIFTEAIKDSEERRAKTEDIITRKNNLLDSSRDEEQVISEEIKDLSVSTFCGRTPRVGHNPNFKAQIGDHLKVAVTHVNSPISFYANIYDTVDDVIEVFAWSYNDLTPSQEMHSPPKLNDILLAQYNKDELWYRAQVMEILPNKKKYRVFYIDVGNTDIVTFSALALCKHDTMQKPPQAVFFRLANLKLIFAKDTTNESCADDEYGVNIISQKFKQATETLVVIIHKQTIEVKVVDCRGKELIVQILDDLYTYIPSMLINMGVVEEV